jgi:hypothetical protein
MPQHPGLFEGDVATPHRRSTLKALGAVVAVALVPLALVVGHLPNQRAGTTAAPAAGVVTPNFASGWLAIQTGSTSKITMSAGTVQQTQQLAPAADCGVNLGPVANQLLTLRGSTGGAMSPTLAAYASGSLGVKEKKSGTSCSQVSLPSESLELGLGQGLRTALGQDAVATSAYLDVELKGSARVLATATLNGTVVGTYEVQSGTSIGKPQVADHTPFVCTSSSDSGPDSGVNDNCRWPISSPSWRGADDGVNFDTLTLKTLVGYFSLEGGADGSVAPPAQVGIPSASVLEIAADTIGCGGQTNVLPASLDAPQVTVYRLDNVGGASCAPTPYQLNNGSFFAQFLKPLTSQTSAQFVWDVTWRLPYDALATPQKDLTIDYETGPLDNHVLGWCPDSSSRATAPFYGGYDANQVAGLPDQDESDGKQFACVISRTATAVNGGAPGTADDYVQARDLIYVLGDATMRR